MMSSFKVVVRILITESEFFEGSIVDALTLPDLSNARTIFAGSRGLR